MGKPTDKEGGLVERARRVLKEKYGASYWSAREITIIAIGRDLLGNTYDTRQPTISSGKNSLSRSLENKAKEIKLGKVPTRTGARFELGLEENEREIPLYHEDVVHGVLEDKTVRKGIGIYPRSDIGEMLIEAQNKI